ncbi:MAG: DNA methyltransferase, partial [Chitinophagales bacterium]
YDKIEDRADANNIVNSIKICDPAVGSGHFLVSALNEMIAVKNDLNILQDRTGKRLKEYHVEVVNDELIVTDEDAELFEYNPNNKESQRIQETLFHEKQTIIENCLFGVDINTNSVKICRLRLWIELLKNAYYKNATELETLPNIDINIKCGNSLVSRFAIDADLKQALKKSKWSIDSYKLAVDTYRNAESKEQKREMERLIADIKSNFRSEISANDPKVKKLYTLNGELVKLSTQQSLFEMSPKEKADWNKKITQLTTETQKLEAEIEEIKSNKIFENAFEWRFEFPEVLNDEGDFVGFDVVIGNPPYIRQEELGEFKTHLSSNFKVFTSVGDIFSYFYELSYNVMRENGYFSFINNTFDKTTAGKSLREFAVKNFSFIKYIDFTDVVVFEEATTYPIILIAKKNIHKNNFQFYKYTKTNFNDKEIIQNESNFTTVEQENLNSTVWNFINRFEQNILLKIQAHKSLISQFGRCYRGILTGFNKAFIIDKVTYDELTQDNINKQIIKPIWEGKDLKKWTVIEQIEKWIIFTRRGVEISEYPLIEKYLQKYKEPLTPKINMDENTGRKVGNYKWYEIQDVVDYYRKFELPKIIFPNLQNVNKFAFDETGVYLNAPSVFLPSNDKALLAVLNSKVVWHFLKSICVIRSGGYIEVKPQYFEQIPIP